MDAGGVEGLVSAADAQETGDVLVFGLAQQVVLAQGCQRPERPVLLAPVEDALGHVPSHARNAYEMSDARPVDVHADLRDAGRDRLVEDAGEETLVDFVEGVA